MPIDFEIPEKLCNKCGKVIPLNGYELDKKGNAKTDENGKLIYHKNGLLACEHCARAASPPAEPKARPLRRGETPEGQTRIDVPSIFIG